MLIEASRPRYTLASKFGRPISRKDMLMSAVGYVPPEVWTHHKPNGGVFETINRPTAGATFEKHLPKGRHPLQLYSQGTWNGMKVTMLLEELLEMGLTGAEYDAWLIDIGKGDQFGSGFVELNPNSKIPALIDHSCDQPVSMFESGAILLYLAEKFRRLIPSEVTARAECLSWLFWQIGSTPYVGGGFAHFYKYAPLKIEYAIDRYTMETKRQMDVLNRRLADRAFIIGSEISIADFAIFPWYGTYALGWYVDVRRFLSVHEYPNLVRWAKNMESRPAVQRGRRVNRTQNDVPGCILERHDASDFKNALRSSPLRAGTAGKV
jgi:GSH-dependent disulfide-bond oxidoreductase